MGGMKMPEICFYEHGRQLFIHATQDFIQHFDNCHLYSQTGKERSKFHTKEQLDKPEKWYDYTYTNSTVENGIISTYTQYEQNIKERISKQT